MRLTPSVAQQARHPNGVREILQTAESQLDIKRGLGLPGLFVATTNDSEVDILERLRDDPNVAYMIP